MAENIFSISGMLEKITQLYGSVTETLEVMSDAELMASFRQGLEEMKENKGIPWEEAKKSLGL